jgi:hypothetical protein
LIALDVLRTIRQNTSGLRITEFIWLEEIVEKLASKHHVEPLEVEELRECAEV